MHIVQAKTEADELRATIARLEAAVAAAKASAVSAASSETKSTGTASRQWQWQCQCHQGDSGVCCYRCSANVPWWNVIVCIRCTCLLCLGWLHFSALLSFLFSLWVRGCRRANPARSVDTAYATMVGYGERVVRWRLCRRQARSCTTKVEHMWHIDEVAAEMMCSDQGNCPLCMCRMDDAKSTISRWRAV
jgi:hypothetical protein